jgi:hypothetical protein
MSISSVTSAIKHTYIPVHSQALSKTLSAEQVEPSNDVVDLSKVAQSVCTSSTQGREQFDFTHMTPKQMKGIANEMFKQGKIDLDQLFQLETAGIPLGKQGPHGEFVQLTPAEREGFMSQPLNYIQNTADRISFLDQSGYANDPKSGYDMLKNLLGKLKTNFG